jgi:hypothetical protein
MAVTREAQFVRDTAQVRAWLSESFEQHALAQLETIGMQREAGSASKNATEMERRRPQPARELRNGHLLGDVGYDLRARTLDEVATCRLLALCFG